MHLSFDITSLNWFIFDLSSKIRRTKENSAAFFICLPASVFHALWTQPENYATCNNDPVHIRTSSWRSGELRINPIALSCFRPLRNGDGYNAVRWPDTDKRLARSRRHHPSVAFTPRHNTQAIRTVNRHCGTDMFLSPFYPRRFLAKRKTLEVKRCDLNARDGPAPVNRALLLDNPVR